MSTQTVRKQPQRETVSAVSVYKCPQCGRDSLRRPFGVVTKVVCGNRKCKCQAMFNASGDIEYYVRTA